MDVDHPRAKTRRRCHGPSDRIRDVVKFEVEEDAITLSGQFFDDGWSVAGEQPAADFEPAGETTKSVGEAPGLVGRVDVQRN